MKNILSFCLLIVIASCTGIHYHDGFYKAEVINPKNFYDIHYEVMKLDGNKVNLTKYSYEGEFAGETIIPCTQFDEKIEFEDAGVTKVLQFNKLDTSYQLNEMVIYKYIGSQGEITITKPTSHPLIEYDQKKGTIKFLSDRKKPLQTTNKENRESSTTTTTTTTTNDQPLDGSTAYYDDADIWKIVVTIKGKNVSFSTYAGDKNELYSDKEKIRKVELAFQENGKILDKYGKESDFSIKNGVLYNVIEEGIIQAYHSKN